MEKKPFVIKDERKRPLVIEINNEVNDVKPSIKFENTNSASRVMVIEDDDELLKPVPGISLGDRKPAIKSPPTPASLAASSSSQRLPLQPIEANLPPSVSVVTTRGSSSDNRIKEPKPKRSRSSDDQKPRLDFIEDQPFDDVEGEAQDDPFDSVKD